MPAALNGDFQKYPEAIREPLSYVAGETCELRQAWAVYHRLFMEDKRLTALLSHQLGGVLGLFQTTLQDEMFLSVARLTDKDNRHQPNLSLWTLRDAVPFAKSPQFAADVDESLRVVCDIAAAVRKHRHKRIAHFDRDVSLKVTPLPVVKFAEIKTVLETIEGYLNLFFWEFEQTTMMFDMLSAHDITGAAEMAVLKAHAYDSLESSGTIPHHEWQRQWRA